MRFHRRFVSMAAATASSRLASVPIAGKELGYSSRAFGGKRSIEVEKKFRIPTTATTTTTASSSSSLESFLSSPSNPYSSRFNTSLNDQYYDNDDSYLLTINDYWLRKRNGLWELKHPNDGNERDGKDVTTYEEISEEEKIQQAVNQLITKSSSTITGNDGPLASWLQQQKIFPFATYHTIRREYLLTYQNRPISIVFDDCTVRPEQLGLSIENEKSEITQLDQVEWKYQLLEIETMVDVKEGESQSSISSQLAEASEVIDQLGKELKLEGLKKGEGKVEKYLLEKRPKHAAALIAAFKRRQQQQPK